METHLSKFNGMVSPDLFRMKKLEHDIKNCVCAWIVSISYPLRKLGTGISLTD